MVADSSQTQNLQAQAIVQVGKITAQIDSLSAEITALIQKMNAMRGGHRFDESLGARVNNLISQRDKLKGQRDQLIAAANNPNSDELADLVVAVLVASATGA